MVPSLIRVYVSMIYASFYPEALSASTLELIYGLVLKCQPSQLSDTVLSSHLLPGRSWYVSYQKWRILSSVHGLLYLRGDSQRYDRW